MEKVLSEGSGNTKRLWIGGVLLLILVCSAGLLFVWDQTRETFGPTKESESTGNPLPSTTVTPQPTPTVLPELPPEEPVVTTYEGRVTSVDTTAKTLILDTARGAKTVAYTDTTAFMVITYDLGLTPDERTTSPEQPIPLTDQNLITPGVVLRATSADNISGATNFTAQTITLIQTINR